MAQRAKPPEPQINDTYTLLTPAAYQRIADTMAELGLDVCLSTPESARARVEAYRAEGKAEAHRERLEAMAAEDLAAEREALAKTLDGKAPTETRVELAFDDVRKICAQALLRETHPTDDPNVVLAMVHEVATLAAQARGALCVLGEIDALREGKAKPTEASMAAYRGGARSAQREGRALAAAADRAMALVQLLMLSLHGRDEQAAKDRAEDHKVIEMHQEVGRELAVIVNEAHDQLDAAGVPRLPAPFDRSVAMRMKVFAAMRQRIIVGVDHGAGKDKSAWTVASVK